MSSDNGHPLKIYASVRPPKFQHCLTETSTVASNWYDEICVVCSFYVRNTCKRTAEL